MKKKKVLFVCNAGLNRSATSTLLLNGDERYLAKHAGTHLLAFVRISKHAVQWADIIICMEKHNKEIILEKFPKESENKEFHVLNIPDVYRKGDKELIKILKKKLGKILKIKFKNKKPEI